jgi:hypothetical protein
MSLTDAINYVINEKKVEGVDYPGSREFIDQFGLQ